MAPYSIHSGQIIDSVDDWFRLAPPAGRQTQWVTYRSAKELARRWVGGEIPPEAQTALDS
jgi:hypothetical protein